MECYPVSQQPPREGVVCLPFDAAAPMARAAFALSDARQLTAPEGLAFLDQNRLGPAPDWLTPAWRRAMEEGRVRAVNRQKPGRPAPWSAGGKKRLNLLALGDVGSTLLLALRLCGGQALSSIGICDVRPAAAQRWEMEINQIYWPGEYDGLPPVEIIGEEQLFDGDAFVFCASKAIPPVGGGVRDVRMAQLEENGKIVAHYARLARQKRFAGLFAVVSDPVDPLCQRALDVSNRDEGGRWDGAGLLPEQIRGFGLGVMNARAAYYAKRDPALSDFLTQGRAYGPHGEDLVIANSLTEYDDERSRRLTRLAVESNLRTRELGFKPFVAPACSSGALSLICALTGRWHYSSLSFGGIFLGCRNRQAPAGAQCECLPLPPALYARLEAAYHNLEAIGHGG